MLNKNNLESRTLKMKDENNKDSYNPSKYNYHFRQSFFFFFACKITEDPLVLKLISPIISRFTNREIKNLLLLYEQWVSPLG